MMKFLAELFMITHPAEAALMLLLIALIILIIYTLVSFLDNFLYKIKFPYAQIQLVNGKSVTGKITYLKISQKNVQVEINETFYFVDRKNITFADKPFV